MGLTPEPFVVFRAALHCVPCNETILVDKWEEHLAKKHPSIKKVITPKIAPGLLRKNNLLQLIEEAQWYQPMSNSSPSCPWCLNQQHWGMKKIAQYLD